MPSNAWTTEHELRFLDALARDTVLLRGYAQALDRRTVWGEVDALTIRSRVTALLAAASPKVKPRRSLRLL